MADKQIVDLNDIVQDTASGDFLVIYDLSGTEDKKISFDDLSTKVLSEFGFTGSTAELNILDGVTATTAELNLLDAGSDEAVYDAGSQVNFRASGVEIINISEGRIAPENNNTVNLGSNGERFKDLYTAGTTLLGGVFALDQTPQACDPVTKTIDATSSKSTITTEAGALPLAIADGRYDGQLKYLYMIVSSGGTATLASPNFIGTSLVFSNRGEGAVLIWDAPAENWFCVNVNGAAWTA